MNKREFVPLAADPQKLAHTDTRPISSRDHVIKKHLVQAADFIHDYRPAPIAAEENEPEIVVEEKDGQIVRIRFMCPCGCQATVDLIAEE